MIAQDGAFAPRFIETIPRRPGSQGLEKKIYAVEGRFFPLSLTGRTEDAFMVPSVLYGNQANLGFIVENGADLPPTDQAVELNEEQQQQLKRARQAVRQLYDTTVTKFNDVAKAKGVSLPMQP
ncbi:MAG: hypothetical protein ACM3SQ_13700 [Betaproteobacteria bacterium]